MPCHIAYWEQKPDAKGQWVAQNEKTLEGKLLCFFNKGLSHCSEI